MYLRFHQKILFVRKVISEMSGKEAIQRIKQNAKVAKQTIDELKNELNVLTNEYNSILTRQLQEENAKLLAAVEGAKNKLIQLEIKNGIKQVSIPNQPLTTSSSEVADTQSINNEDIQSSNKPKKEKKEKLTNQQKSDELPIDVGRLDLRIGKIEDVKKHPDADTLYVLQINVGEEKRRTVCSGLVKYIPMENLKDRLVVVLCNLKPVKMRGITSEAMVMCAIQTEDIGSLIIETIIPPENSTPGDLVHCEGYTRQPDPIMNPKKKIFETVAPDLHTDNTLQVCYKSIPLQVPGRGICHSKTLKNVLVR